MAIIVGVLLGLVWLYLWLIGQWFARVVGVLAFAPLLAIGGGALLNAVPGATETAAILGAAIGVGCSWFVAGLPTYYWRGQARQYAAAVAGYPPAPSGGWMVRQLRGDNF